MPTSTLALLLLIDPFKYGNLGEMKFFDTIKWDRQQLKKQIWW